MAVEKVDLSDVSTPELLNELLRRVKAGEKITNEDGSLPDALWALVKEYSIIACVDAIPVRTNDAGEVELGAIVRNTGKYQGKLAQVGGRMQIGENPQMALSRHLKTDLGLDFSYYDQEAGPNKPLYVTSYKPKEKDSDERPEVFADDPTKHSLAMTFLVTIPKDQEMQFGKGAGGQEAGGFQWFTENQLAQMTEDDFAFEQRHLFSKAFAEVKRIKAERAGRTERTVQRASADLVTPPVVSPFF